ncbi:hypothetical protein MUP32_04565 [Candidatus Microgenomates bacterium]|nr:hypothetical protein [Candidatus Microgenomates bacterium]
MPKIALVTYSQYQKLTTSDNFLIKPLKEAGFDPTAVAWDDDKVNWQQFDLIILRSCWNYHLKVNEFTGWLDYLEKNKLRVFNPVSLLKWNLDKKYLLDLEKKGIPIIPTVFIKKGSTIDLIKIIEENNWPEIVIKPTIGASAYEVHKVTTETVKPIQSKYDQLVNRGDVMIQPLMKEVVTEGEYSFVFLGGRFSHAILKKPKSNEFRTNYRFGGTCQRVEPAEKLLLQATTIMKAIPSPALYARVDGLNINGKLTLMELELIDPHLFFDLYPPAADKLVKAITKV